MPHATNRTNQYITGTIIVILAAAALLWARTSHAPATSSAKTATATTTTVGTATDSSSATMTTTPDDRQLLAQPSGESIAVTDQPAGIMVKASFTLTHDSWVGVRDEKGILGVSLFKADATSGDIELLRGTLPGKTYTAVIFNDNGNRAFDLYTDPLVNGVSATFTAQ